MPRTNAQNQAAHRQRQAAKVAAMHRENENLRAALRGRTRAILDTNDQPWAEVERLRAEVAALRAGRPGTLRSTLDVILGR
jgi:hypothetical protein